jgi:hypothetical protein
MKKAIQQHPFAKTAAVAVAMFSAVGLSACGGGSGDGPASGAAAAAHAAIGKAPALIKVEGASTSLSSEFETVSTMTPPATWMADGSLPQGDVRLSYREQAASLLKEHAPGAYTTLPWGDETLSLSAGTVTDLAGNGQFAIGRWTAGSDSAGNSYNANQGRAWAVGAPVQVAAIQGRTLSCSLVAATRPTSSDGNTAPGVLTAADATVSADFDWWDGWVNQASLRLGYSIGSDVDRTFFSTDRVGAMSLSKASGSSIATTFFGPDASKPYLVVSYGIHAPTVGLVNGIAVLSCS